MRVTDDMVHSFLVWARNYGEIKSFTKVAESGRKWRIRIPEPVSATGRSGQSMNILDRIWGATRVVPTEFVLTNREAFTFGYGLAVAGARSETRAEFAAREWGWEV